MGIRGDDVNLAPIPLGHSYGLGNLVVPLWRRAALVTGVAAAAARHRGGGRALAADGVPAVPALLRALATADSRPPTCAAAHRDFGGAPLAPEVAAAFHARFGKKSTPSTARARPAASPTTARANRRWQTAASAGRLPGVRLTPGRGRSVTIASAAAFTLGNRTPGAHRLKDRVAFTADGEVVLLAAPVAR